jgi:thiosulfate/3-mercaptopyruvate sulfurtransferase
MEERDIPGIIPEPHTYPRVRWVTPDWLDDHRQDAGLIILDTRPNSHVYFSGHIPGALFLHEAHLRTHAGTNPVHWIAPEAARLLFSPLGIDPEKPVVVYAGTNPSGSAAGAGDGMEQYLVAYSLARFGCRNVIILDGGMSRWSSSNYPLDQKPGIALTFPFPAELQADFFISREECTLLKDRRDTVLLDTRPSDWYMGQGPWMKPGHIPGAISLPAGILLDPDNRTLLLPEAEIRDILERLEITPDKTIICSCGTGRTATAVFLILKFFLGYPDVVMYEGGFTEWSAIPENAVVTGKNPR